MKRLKADRQKKPILSEQGAVSVLAIMALLLLTIAGIASLYTARTEIQIAGNEREYVSSLTSSDAAVHLAAQSLTNSSNTPGGLLGTSAAWINLGSQSDRENDLVNMISSFTSAAPGTAPATATAATIAADTYYSALYWGIAQGSSLNMTQANPLREYSLYGFYNRDLGSGSSIRSLLESGYRNR